MKTSESFSASEWWFSLSLANLIYLKTWAIVLQTDRNITPTALIAAMVNVILLALCIRAGIALIQRTGSRVLRGLSVLIFAALLLLPFHAITTIYFPDEVRPRNAVYAAGGLAALAVIFSSRARRIARGAILLITPLVAITFAQGVFRAWSYDAARWKEPSMPAAPSSRPVRLVWLLFDEWDYGLTFESPKVRVPLPEIARLQAESFTASNAVPPGPVTGVSVPRLLTSDIQATVASLPSRSDIFTRTKSEGLSVAVAGWYLPYCDLFAKSLSVCWTCNRNAERNNMGNSFPEIGLNQVRNLFENQFRSPFGQPLGASRQALDYKLVFAATNQAAANPAFDMVFAHFPVPHEPLFYDSSTGRFDLSEKPGISLFKKNFLRYMDAVQLVDSTFGQLRNAMQAAGVWEKTHVLLTSDHGYRNRHRVDGVRSDSRVPFLVRVAGSPQEISFPSKFNTVLSSDLAMALLNGVVKSPGEVQGWIERRLRESHK